MIIKYKYGFKHNGVTYGFEGENLHRVPQKIGSRFYSKKVMVIREEIIGGSDWLGYRLYGDSRKTIAQIECMKCEINYVFDPSKL